MLEELEKIYNTRGAKEQVEIKQQILVQLHD